MKETICELFIERIKKSSSKQAIGYFHKNQLRFLDFKNYKSTVEGIGLGLLNLGLDLQGKVCIFSQTRKEWHFIDLGIMNVGGVTVPIYPSYTDDEAQYILNHSEAKMIFVENAEQFEKILTIQHKTPHLSYIISIEEIKTDLIAKLSDNINYLTLDDCLNIGLNEAQKHPDLFINNMENISAEHIASIIYTSGTTGKPKGAVISHEALYQVLINVKKFTKSAINGDDRFLTFLPLSHVLGRLESFFPILFGVQAVYVTDMKKLLDYIPKVQPTIIVAVPRVLEKVYEKAQSKIQENEIKKSFFTWATKTANKYHEIISEDLTPPTSLILQYQVAKKVVFNKIYELFGGRLRYFISGGAPLSPTIMKFLRNANLTVLEGYGLTETIAPCFLNPLNRQVAGTVGQPLGDVEIKFSDENEILIRSKALFTEYYKNPEETKKVLTEDGWFHTGDIGEFNNDGYLRITDRKKDIIITSGGKNIAPQKIENMLKLSPYIAQSVIIGDKRKYLTALIAVEWEALQPHFKSFEISEDASYKDISHHPEVIKLINQAVLDVNSELASFETIKKFQILPCEMVQNNYLTPSLKIKKKKVIQDYSSLINAMYS